MQLNKVKQPRGSIPRNSKFDAQHRERTNEHQGWEWEWLGKVEY